jgi:hypothetical protein
LFNDGGNQAVYTTFGGNDVGLYINYNANFYALGDWNNLVNHSYLIVDDSTQAIRMQGNTSIALSTVLLEFPNSGINTSGSFSPSGRNLTVTVGGTTYYLALLN